MVLEQVGCVSRVNGNSGNGMFFDFQDLCRVRGAFSCAAPPNCPMLLFQSQCDDLANQFCLELGFLGSGNSEPLDSFSWSECLFFDGFADISLLSATCAGGQNWRLTVSSDQSSPDIAIVRNTAGATCSQES